MPPLLELKNLHVAVEGKEVLKGIDLKLDEGRVHAIMGPNGSGKSTLAAAILGHPKYAVTEGSIHFLGDDITRLPTSKRAQRGLFLSFQHPAAVPGVSVANLIRTSYKNLAGATKVDVKAFRSRLLAAMEKLHMNHEMLDRSMNDGFSGGEKKTAEVLQLTMLEPKLAILDEIDSGLDIDALKRISAALSEFMRQPKRSLLCITHYRRILDYLRPDKVHVLIGGRIVRSGGPELAEELERSGYEAFAS